MLAARAELDQAKRAVRQADDMVRQIVEHLADIQPGCSEILNSIHIGLPRSLMTLWRPGRSQTYFDDFELLESPSRNRVFRATSNGMVHAVKVFPSVSKANLKTCFREACLLRRMQHPGIVQIDGIFFEEPVGGVRGRFCIQMPFYENGPSTCGFALTRQMPRQSVSRCSANCMRLRICTITLSYTPTSSPKIS